jgi:sugar lactone lactonase YvrE
MFSRWKNLFQRASRPLRGGRRRRSCPLQVEALETRLTPAFNLIIGAAQTAHVAHDAATGTFIAHGTKAIISVADIQADLLAGKNVTITDGNTGTETGTITWLAGFDLDYRGIGAGNQTLTIAVDPSAKAASVQLGGKIFDSHPPFGNLPGDILNVHVSATKDLTVTSVLYAGGGAVTLEADTARNGQGDDGVGTLTLGPGTVVSGGSVTLRGADVHIDTSANPASVHASANISVFPTSLLLPYVSDISGIVFDAHGNLFASNRNDGTITEIAPSGQRSLFAAHLVSPGALAFDAAGNLYVANASGNTLGGTVNKITPQGKVSAFASGYVSPSALAFDAAGNLYVADVQENCVFQVTPGGQQTVFVSGLNEPQGLAIDAGGNLYLADADGTILKVTPDGHTVTPFATGFDHPAGLAFDNLGYLYVANVGGANVCKVTPQGQISAGQSYQGYRDTPAGLAIDPQGNLFSCGAKFGILARAALGTVTVRSSLPARPIYVGLGMANGLTLTSAEAAQIAIAKSTLILGDPAQTGDISFTTANFLAGTVFVQQNPSAGGRIVLDGVGSVAALSTRGNVSLSAGAGGIVAANPSDGTAEFSAAELVQLYTAGPVGSRTNRLQFAGAALVSVGAAAPNSVFLDGLDNLTLSNVVLSDRGSLDVTARGNLDVSAGATVRAQIISLAADVKPDATGDDGVGTLSVAAGATVTGTTVTLRGADIFIDSSAKPATVSALRQDVVFARVGSRPAGVAIDAQGNLFVANPGNGTVSKVTPAGQVSTFLAGLNDPFALAFDKAGNLFVATIADNTIRKVAPDGRHVTVFTQQVRAPSGLAFDAQGNLCVSSFVAGTVSKVSPDGRTVTTFLTGVTTPTGLAFDAQGFLYVINHSQGSIFKVTPDGRTLTAIATGLGNPDQMAFDARGNLYVSSPIQGAVYKVTPLGQKSVYASGNGLNLPAGLAFDAQGNLFVSNSGSGTLSRITPGTVTLRSSLPARPIAVGGAVDLATSINLSNAGLARINAADILTVGDASQQGDIFLVTATTHAPLVEVVQDTHGPGSIVLDDGGIGAGLFTSGGDVQLNSGNGGVREIDTGAGSVALDAEAGALFFNVSDAGTLNQPLTVRAALLGTSKVTGLLTLNDTPGPTAATAALTTSGPIAAGFVELILGGNFVTHSGDLNARAIDLVFSGGNHLLDAGGQSFTDVTVSNGSTLHLVDTPLALSGTLTVDGLFDAGTLPVAVHGLILSPSGTLLAPPSLFTDSGDWLNLGGNFEANGGTVVLDGMNQHVGGSTTFYNLTKVATHAETLTFQALSSQSVLGLLTLQGSPTAPLQLRSSLPGVPWGLGIVGGFALTNLSIRDSLNLTSPSKGIYVATSSAPSPADVVVQADVALAPTGMQFAGLVARDSRPGDTNMYVGALVSNNGFTQACIFKVMNGVWTTLASLPAPSGTGTLKFQVKGSSLELFLEGDPVAIAFDDALPAGGRVGVRVSDGVGVTNYSTAMSPP